MKNHSNNKPQSFPQKITFKLSSKGKWDVAKRAFSPKKHGKQSFGGKNNLGLCSRNSWISETYAETTLMAGLPSGSESGQKE